MGQEEVVEELVEVQTNQLMDNMISSLDKILQAAKWYNQIKEVNAPAAQMTLANLQQLVKQVTLLSQQVKN